MSVPSGVGAVGVGVIGAGVISTQYLENLTAFPDLRVLFIADLDVDRAQEQATKFGVPGAGSVDELLAHPEIEIVVNLTIPAAHVEVANRVLDSGKHVWNEKPLSLDRESGRALLDRAKELGLRVAAAPDTFLGAGLQTGMRLLAEGRIGTPVTAIAIMRSPGPESWHPNPDFFYVPGGGPLFDIGPYYLTTLVQNLGPVSRVAATRSTARAMRTIGSGPRAGATFPVTTPTHFSALLQFAGGATAQCTFSFESSIEQAGIVEFAGTEGAIVFPDPNMFTGDLAIWHDDSTEAQVVEATGVTTMRGTGVLELARAIRAGVPERASGEQAFHIVDVMVSITEAAESGEWVAVRSTTSPAEPLPEGWDPTASTL